MSERTCPTCGRTLVQRAHENATRFANRRYCSRACGARSGTNASTVARQKRRAALLEDVEWLLGTDAPENIAHRVGYRDLEALERFLYRAERPDLARRLHDWKEAS